MNPPTSSKRRLLFGGNWQVGKSQGPVRSGLSTCLPGSLISTPSAASHIARRSFLRASGLFAGDPDEVVEGRTSAGNYNPVYYALTGLPSLATSGSAAVYGMRLVNSLLSCVFLALAFAALSQMRQRKWAMVATVVSVTPVVLFLNGAVNPNAL